MLLGKVLGTLTPAMIYEGLEGVPMLIVQPLSKDGKETGQPLIAADSTRMAGSQEIIYYEGGREAAMALDLWFVPVDHTIIVIVDGINHLPEEVS